LCGEVSGKTKNCAFEFVIEHYEFSNDKKVEVFENTNFILSDPVEGLNRAEKRLRQLLKHIN
jgi:hypothetical protein